jgi:pimeloyl-ACP methyl ester carboxylesterase
MDPATLDANGLRLAYETFGEEGDPPVVLVMGLGTQMIWWEDPFCEALAARGLHVIRFDNRDVGLSTHLDDAPMPDVFAAVSGDTSGAAYTLDDMADDAVGLLDALAIDSAHFVGASMGGMIVQTVAIRHPARVRSLVSIMSNTGDPSVGQPTEEAMHTLLAPMPVGREEVIERTLATWRFIRSPGFGWDEDRVRELATLSYDRAHDPAGFARQLVAILASGDRTEALGTVDVPALVIHGDADNLVQPSGGEATARAIPGAELVTVEGMAHDLPQEIWPRLVEAIAATVERGEAARVEV